MLEDITTNTIRVFKQFIPKNKPVNSKKYLYNTYRAMQQVVDNIHIVSEHYLALDFTEEFLQNSSFGEPSDKWRRFFNEDLESLNKSIKKYLLRLYIIGQKDKHSVLESYLSKTYNAKTFYGFVRDEYSVGHVEPCSFKCVSDTLVLEHTPKKYYLHEWKKIELETYEQRVALQSDLREKYKIMKDELLKLKSYIQNNYTLDELL